MEFQEFWKQFNRMCESCKCSNDCGFSKMFANTKGSVMCKRICANNPKEAEQIVEQWAKENPIPTNKDKFQEVFGQMPSSLVCLFVDNKLKCGSCSECEYNDWWEKEYKLPKGEEV